MQLSFTISNKSITIFLAGDVFTVDVANPNYQPLADELKKPKDERDLELIKELGNLRKQLQRLDVGRVTITETAILFDGIEVNNYLSRRMLELVREGFDPEIWATFMNNAYENPEDFAREELFEWIEKAEMPLTDDGHFLAFKKVRNNYKDVHSGKFDHSIGCLLEMDRDLCDTNRNRTCSTGFHFCSQDYLSSFGGDRVMVVKVNPRDVTSIPSDYDLAKGRCCRYEVIAELTSDDAAYSKAWRTSVFPPSDGGPEYPESFAEVLEKPKPIKIKKSAPVNKLVTGTAKKKPFALLNGVPFNKKQVRGLLKDYPSVRAAARSIGAPESTLRGYKKKLEKKV